MKKLNKQKKTAKAILSAKEEFYAGVKKIKPAEAGEITYYKESGNFSPAYLREDRLAQLLEAFIMEIKFKVADFNPQAKQYLIDEYLVEAQNWLKIWLAEKENFIIKAPNLMWRIASNNLNIHIMNQLIGRLEELKGRIPDVPTPDIIDPLTFIDPFIMENFLRIEKLATDNTLRFDSGVRCAAFCEWLYEKKYIIPVPNFRRKTMNNFAKARYNLEITNALSTDRKQDRNNHRTKVVKGKPPLNKLLSQ